MKDTYPDTTKANIHIYKNMNQMFDAIIDQPQRVYSHDDPKWHRLGFVTENSSDLYYMDIDDFKAGLEILRESEPVKAELVSRALLTGEGRHNLAQSFHNPSQRRDTWKQQVFSYAQDINIDILAKYDQIE